MKTIIDDVKRFLQHGCNDFRYMRENFPEAKIEELPDELQKQLVNKYSDNIEYFETCPKWLSDYITSPSKRGYITLLKKPSREVQKYCISDKESATKYMTSKWDGDLIVENVKVNHIAVYTYPEYVYSKLTQDQKRELVFFNNDFLDIFEDVVSKKELQELYRKNSKVFKITSALLQFDYTDEEYMEIFDLSYDTTFTNTINTFIENDKLSTELRDRIESKIVDKLQPKTKEDIEKLSLRELTFLIKREPEDDAKLMKIMDEYNENIYDSKIENFVVLAIEHYTDNSWYNRINPKLMQQLLMHYYD